MSQAGDAIGALVTQLSRLPGIGERTATRLAFFFLSGPPDLPEALAEALIGVKTKVRRCSCCGNVTEADPCRICAATTRDRSMICVVEGPSDVVALERTGEFRGTYHVLNGLLRPLDGVGPDALNLASLVRRIGIEPVTEVVVATNPSVEGEATAVYIRNILGAVGVKVSRIASGIPIGGELEYADRATLGRALTGRQTMS